MLTTVHNSVSHSFTPVENYVQYDGHRRLHIGATVREYLEQNDTRYSGFADKIGMSRAGLYNIFKDRHISTDRLEKICQVTGHNFFQYFADLYSTPDMQVVKESTAEYQKPAKQKIVLDLEDGKVVNQSTKAVDEETEDEMIKESIRSMIKEEQQGFMDQLMRMLPEMAKKMNENPGQNPLNIEDTPSEKE